MTRRPKTLWLKRNRSLFFSNWVIQGKRGGTQDYPGIQASQLALSLSLIPGHQEGGKKPRASVLSYMSRLLTSHWPKLSHVATAHFKRGRLIWAPTRQPCSQLKPGVEREVMLLLKERESDSWGQFSSLHLSGNPTSQAGTPPHTLYSVHSFHRLYFPWGLLNVEKVSYPLLAQRNFQCTTNKNWKIQILKSEICYFSDCFRLHIFFAKN